MDSFDIVQEARMNNIERVRNILEASPGRVNDTDTKTGMTALHWAAGLHNVEMAKLLCSKEGAWRVDISIRDKWARTAFDMTRIWGSSKIHDIIAENVFEHLEAEDIKESESAHLRVICSDDELNNNLT